MLDVRPDALLAEIQQHRRHQQIQHDLPTDALALIERRIGRPRQERGDVAGVVIDRWLGAVLISYSAIARAAAA